eukprot:evm.model.scf_1999.1 EVM.evm.TU.scf_1999.1   scf_1999:2600-4626(-)
MASQARLDLEEALHLVDKMDECFLKMVPTEQAISAAADRRQTDEELQAEAAENAKAFFDSASKLDDHLHTFEAAPPQLSTIQKLKQEIDELQEELREKASGHKGDIS